VNTRTSRALDSSVIIALLLGACLIVGQVCAQERDQTGAQTQTPTVEQGKEQEEETATESDYGFTFETGLVSKFMWRGQRLSDGWVLQPAATVTAKGFSFNMWTNFELQAVNEGDTCLLRLNPDALAGGSNGLQGKFSEVDFTLSYAREYKGVSFEGGAIIYTLPYNRISTPTTTELYGSVSFDSAPLSPGVALYVDVDETRELGKTGAYLELSAGHSFEFSGERIKSIDLSGTLGIGNSGFANYCYEFPESGAHDASFTIGLPIDIGKGWSTNLFLSYSALLGKYRDYQYVNLPDLYRGTAGDPRSYADTVWGGIVFTLEK
jgi:hypothetical protein